MRRLFEGRVYLRMVFTLFGIIINAITVSSNDHVHRHVHTYACNNFLLECHVVSMLDSAHALAQFSAAVRLCSIKVRHLFKAGIYFHHLLFPYGVYLRVGLFEGSI